MKETFDLKLGWLCNNKCVHCVVKGKEKRSGDLTTQEAKDIIKYKTKLDKIVFTGGEPTARKDIVELLRYSKSLGVTNVMQTNGRRFYRDDFTKASVPFLDGVLFTIHSHDECVHDSITKVPGSWKQSVEGIKNIYKMKPGIIASQTVISKKNAPDLHKTYEFIQSIAPGIQMNLTFPHPMGAAGDDFYNVVPKYEDIEEELRIILGKYIRLLNIEAIPKCYIYPYVRYEDWEHIHTLDPTLDHADKSVSKRGFDSSNKDDCHNDVTEHFFNEEGITDDYSLAILSDYRKGEICKECAIYDKCAGVWKEYFYGYQDELDLRPLIN